MRETSIDIFNLLEIRTGTIVSAGMAEGLQNPAYKLKIDFGEYGILNTSAQITKLYSAQELINKQVVAVVNLPKKQIKNFMSECLVLGAVGNNSEVTIIQPERKVTNGLRIL